MYDIEDLIHRLNFLTVVQDYEIRSETIREAMTTLKHLNGLCREKVAEIERLKNKKCPHDLAQEYLEGGLGYS